MAAADIKSSKISIPDRGMFGPSINATVPAQNRPFGAGGAPIPAEDIPALQPGFSRYVAAGWTFDVMRMGADRGGYADASILDDENGAVLSCTEHKLKTEVKVHRTPRLPAHVTARWIARSGAAFQPNTELYVTKVPFDEVTSTLTFRIAYKKDWPPGIYALQLEFGEPTEYTRTLGCVGLCWVDVWCVRWSSVF